MSHSKISVWIHIVWRTKNHEHFFLNGLERIVGSFMKEKASETGIPFLVQNLQPDHFHGLIRLPSNRCIADFSHTIKGATSHWINKNNIVKGHFSWQTGYGAFSVQYNNLQTVIRYIDNQDEHHRRKSSEEEWEDLDG